MPGTMAVALYLTNSASFHVEEIQLKRHHAGSMKLNVSTAVTTPHCVWDYCFARLSSFF
jgi:hypothetical protein